MRFTKMHGIGNCYVFVDCFDTANAESALLSDTPALARTVSDRNTGVGSDGLILIHPSEVADARMEMYNLDGSRGQMCGNGIRCLAKYVHDHGLSNANPMKVETDSGIMTLDLYVVAGKVAMVTVDMGEPRLEPGDLPVQIEKSEMIDREIIVMNHRATMTCLSMGNPHAIIYGVPLSEFTPKLLAQEGAVLETHPIFPERANIHFVEVNTPDDVTMLTWERGSGATQACGTGASAVGVAGVLTGRSDRQVTTHLPGGDLQIEWREDNHVYMRGPAAEIFTGEWPE
jgi:diaminopimelate epimerase